MKRLVIVIMVLLVAASAGAWEFDGRTDLMTDAVTNYARLRAIDHQNTAGAPVLVIRTAGDKITIYITSGPDLVARDVSEILVRFGSSDPISWPAAPGTSPRTVVIQDTDRFLERMRFKRLVVQWEGTLTYRPGGTIRNMIGVWNIDDIDELLRRLGQ